MNRTAFTFAASTAIVSMTLVACTTQSIAMRRLGPAAAASRPDRQAAQLYDQASRALRAGQLSAALGDMEQAVALSPRDAGYRLLLAEIYLTSGRFESARATFGDVLELDPSNVRAGLSFALTQIALGRPQSAVAHLDNISSGASPADVGLAFALAGQPQRAIEILEPAARSPSATARTRQNLALAYALAGDWRRARAVAAQDVSPAELGQRMEQWAAFARPGAAATQVAGLLGVTPIEDAGQPVRLALAPAAAAPVEAHAEAAPIPTAVPAVPTPAYAEAAYAEPAPAEAPAAEPAAEAPAQYAAAESPPVEAPAFWVPTAQSYQPAPEPAEAPAEAAALPDALPEVQFRYAAAARSLIRPQPALIRASAARTPAPAFQRERPRAAVRRGSAPVVVQIGAFSNEGNAERAWVQAERRFALHSHRPLTTTISLNGRTLHRVSVAGFASAADAGRLCGTIRSQGGVCFVRGQAGDASIRWAARYAQGRNRNV